MRIEVRDAGRRRVGRVEVDPAERPTRTRTADGRREVYLEWEAAIDDAGRLRRCIVCGCRDLYKVRTFPQVTGFVVVLAFAGAAVGIFGGGIAENPWVLAALVVVLILDVASLILRRLRLVCYRCGSTYADIDVARHYLPWDRELARRHEADLKRETVRSGAPDTVVGGEVTEGPRDTNRAGTEEEVGAWALRKSR